MGYLPAGVLNYLALLGWATSDNRELFTLLELIDAFDIKNVHMQPASFDPKKFIHINAEHMQKRTGTLFPGVCDNVAQRRGGGHVG
jgi:glutamyl-tRNA synthetase